MVFSIRKVYRAMRADGRLVGKIKGVRRLIGADRGPRTDERERSHGSMRNIDDRIDKGFHLKLDAAAKPMGRLRHLNTTMLRMSAGELSGKTVVLRFHIRAVGRIGEGEEARMLLMAHADPAGRSAPPADAFARWQISFDGAGRHIALEVKVPDCEVFELRCNADWGQRVGWQIENLHLLTADARIDVDGDGTTKSELRLTKRWSLKGRKLEVEWLGRRFFAMMPEGYDLDALEPEALSLAEELLFGEIERRLFGVTPRAASAEFDHDAAHARFADVPVSKYGLCFSTGEDSTAALRVLPSDLTVPIYSERPMKGYARGDGRAISLPSNARELVALDRVPDAVRIPTDFEEIGLSVGMGFGYRDGVGYAVLPVLLSKHLGLNAVGFGTPMEVATMRMGTAFLDVSGIKSSKFRRYRGRFAEAGMHYSMPIAGLSEVLTNRICTLSRDRYEAVPCPKTDAHGNPCGTCFKCFRKMRFEGAPAPEPSAGVIKNLHRRPLPVATSVVYAAQKAGYTEHSLDEYATVDLTFLDRYFGYAVDNFLPADVALRVRQELDSLGISPMTEADEAALRSIGEVFSRDKP